MAQSDDLGVTETSSTSRSNSSARRACVGARAVGSQKPHVSRRSTLSRATAAPPCGGVCGAGCGGCRILRRLRGRLRSVTSGARGPERRDRDAERHDRGDDSHARGNGSNNDGRVVAAASAVGEQELDRLRRCARSPSQTIVSPSPDASLRPGLGERPAGARIGSAIRTAVDTRRQCSCSSKQLALRRRRRRRHRRLTRSLWLRSSSPASWP